MKRRKQPHFRITERPQHCRAYDSAGLKYRRDLEDYCTYLEWQIAQRRTEMTQQSLFTEEITDARK